MNDYESKILDIKRINYVDGDEAFCFELADGTKKSYYLDDENLSKLLTELKRDAVSKIKYLKEERKDLRKKFRKTEEYQKDKKRSLILTIATKIVIGGLVGFIMFGFVSISLIWDIIISLIIGLGVASIVPEVAPPVFEYSYDEDLSKLKQDVKAIKAIQKHIKIKLGKINGKDPLEGNKYLNRINVISENPQNTLELEKITNLRKRKYDRLTKKVAKIRTNLAELNSDVPSIDKLILLPKAIHIIRKSRLERNGGIKNSNSEITMIAIEILKKKTWERKENKIDQELEQLDSDIKYGHSENHQL